MNTDSFDWSLSEADVSLIAGRDRLIKKKAAVKRWEQFIKVPVYLVADLFENEAYTGTFLALCLRHFEYHKNPLTLPDEYLKALGVNITRKRKYHALDKIEGKGAISVLRRRGRPHLITLKWVPLSSQNN